MVDWRRAFENSSAWTERARRPVGINWFIDGLDLRLPWREEHLRGDSDVDVKEVVQIKVLI